MTKKITNIILVLVLSLLVLNLRAQNRNIVGRVVAEDGKPSVGSVVKLVGTSVQAITEANGLFFISVPSGAYQLEVTPAPNNPEGKEIFDIDETIFLTVGSLFMGKKIAVPGLADDFVGRSEYMADRNVVFFGTTPVGDKKMPTQQTIVRPNEEVSPTPIDQSQVAGVTQGADELGKPVVVRPNEKVSPTPIDQSQVAGATQGADELGKPVVVRPNEEVSLTPIDQSQVVGAIQGADELGKPVVVRPNEEVSPTPIDQSQVAGAIQGADELGKPVVVRPNEKVSPTPIDQSQVAGATQGADELGKPVVVRPNEEVSPTPIDQSQVAGAIQGADELGNPVVVRPNEEVSPTPIDQSQVAGATQDADELGKPVVVRPNEEVSPTPIDQSQVAGATQGADELGKPVVVRPNEKVSPALTDQSQVAGATQDADELGKPVVVRPNEEVSPALTDQSQVARAIQDADELDEIIVVGYGTVKKKDATGAVGVIENKDFNQGINVSPETLFQGKLSGIQVTSSSGEPGSATNIRIRGTSSVRANNNPLIVVDGFPLGGGNVSDNSDDGSDDFGAGGAGIGTTTARNPLNFINPADIERIDILKDASATAIYGSRGANGVVLITTKKGSYTKPLKVVVNAEVSLSDVPKRIDLMDATRYLDNGFRLAVDKAIRSSTLAPTRAEYEATNNFGHNTDWQEEIFRLAFTQNYSVSFDGGTKSSNYRFSAGYLNQDGVVEKTNLEKYTAQLSLSQRFFQDKVEIGAFINYSLLNDTYAPVSNNAGFEGNLVGAALQANPTRPVWELQRTPAQIQSSPSLGGRYFQDKSVFRNPTAMLDYVDESSKTSRILGNLYLKAKLTPWLTYKVSGGIDYASSTRKGHLDYYLDLDVIRREYTGIADKASLNDARVTTLGGLGYVKNRITESQLMEHTLTVDTELSKDLNFNFLLGYSYQKFLTNSYRTRAKNFTTNRIRFYDNLDGADNTGGNAFSAFTDQATVDELQSFFGRVNLGYKSKYLFTATLRTDGSTKFGDNNKYGIFPSFAFAWGASEESFVPDIFNELKLRIGYGITGNQEIPGRISRASYSVDASGNRVFNTTPNPDIKWESTAGFNAGIDFGLSNNRFYGTIEYFHKTTTDLLFLNAAPQPSPNPNVWENLDAEVINSGIELQLNAVLIDKEVKWTLGGNLTYVDNSISNYNGFKNTGAINGQGLTGAFAQRIVGNQPLNVYYMFEFLGNDVEGTPTFARADEKATTLSGEAEKKYVGTPNPDLLFGINTTVAYKNFDLTILLSGVSGNKIYNNTANALFYTANITTGKNATVAVGKSDQNPQSSAIVSTQYLEDGSFLRLSNLVLGYNFALKSAKYIKGIRAYFAAQNLFVITGYSGFDPEVNVDKSIDDIPSFGIDYHANPRARTFTLGLNVIF